MRTRIFIWGNFIPYHDKKRWISTKKGLSPFLCSKLPLNPLFVAFSKGYWTQIWAFVVKKVYSVVLFGKLQGQKCNFHILSSPLWLQIFPSYNSSHPSALPSSHNRACNRHRIIDKWPGSGLCFYIHLLINVIITCKIMCWN